MNKNVGRPTESKKDLVLKVRIDQKTKELLDKLSIELSMTKSEIVRIGIDRLICDKEKEN